MKLNRPTVRNYPVFIIEGPDAVGKTTLCDQFSKIAGARRIHLTLRREMHKWQVVALLHALKLSEKQPVIIDRHWPSEHIYAGVYRGGTSLEKEGRDMDDMISWLGIPYIFCHFKSVEEMVEAHKLTHTTGREMYEPDHRIKEIAAGYMQWWYGDVGPWEKDDRLALCSVISSHGGMSRRRLTLDYNWKEVEDTEQFVHVAIARGRVGIADHERRSKKSYGTLQDKILSWVNFK